MHVGVAGADEADAVNDERVGQGLVMDLRRRTGESDESDLGHGPGGSACPPLPVGGPRPVGVRAGRAARERARDIAG